MFKCQYNSSFHVGGIYTVKKVNDFPNQTLPSGNKIIIPGQGEFG